MHAVQHRPCSSLAAALQQPWSTAVHAVQPQALQQQAAAVAEAATAGAAAVVTAAAPAAEVASARARAAVKKRAMAQEARSAKQQQHQLLSQHGLAPPNVTNSLGARLQLHGFLGCPACWADVAAPKA